MPEPLLKTERLRLRPIQQGDVRPIHDMLSAPEVDRYNTLGIPKNFDVSKAIVAELVANRLTSPVTSHTFTILTPNRQFIGLIAITPSQPKVKRAEVWYKLSPSTWGQGFATEAVRAALKFGFESLDLHRIEAGCATENIGSIRVLEKVGMTREGRKRETLPLVSGWSDNFEYGILRSQWKLDQGSS